MLKFLVWFSFKDSIFNLGLLHKDDISKSNKRGVQIQQQ